MKLILYHGTSEKNAKQIQKEGFVADKHYNWKLKGKRGFIYLSSAYAPFYAMNCSKAEKLALIKCEVDLDDCYPEDDFLVYAKVCYHRNINKINFDKLKYLAKESLNYIGNIAVKPNKIKILGVKCFSGKGLIYRCDPVISPLNFKFMGDYYKKLTKDIFEGKDIFKEGI